MYHVTNQFDYLAIYDQIPPTGARKCDLARMLGQTSKCNSVDGMLASMELRGLLLMEDDKGRIFRFEGRN